MVEAKITGNADAWILISISLILIVIFWTIVTYLSIDSIPEVSSGSVLLTCPTGQCATNIYSGQKRCPSPTEQIVADSLVEVCSSPSLCDNNMLPYAIQSDLSTNQQGVCEPGITCRCVDQVRCPEYVTSYFETINGNPYVSLRGQRTSFVQYQDGNTTPLSLTDPFTQFCTVPFEWLSRSSPGCPDGLSITQCMGGQNSCYGATFNPCLSGTLAFITNDSGNFDINQVNRIPLACVNGKPGPCGTVSIYDTKLGDIVYKEIE